MRGQLLPVSGEERRAGKEAEVGGEEIMPEAGHGDFARLHRAAGLVRAFNNGDLPALGREVHRRGEAVVPGTDHDCVVAVVAHKPAPGAWRSSQAGSITGSGIASSKVRV